MTDNIEFYKFLLEEFTEPGEPYMVAECARQKEEYVKEHPFRNGDLIKEDVYDAYYDGFMAGVAFIRESMGIKD